MSNLVDDFKNMMPGGVRIRSTVIDISANNTQPSLNLFEGILCKNSNAFVNPYPVTLWFKTSVTQDFIIFNIPMGEQTHGTSLSASLEVSKFITYDNLVNSRSVQLYPYWYKGTTGNAVSEYMIWLVLRIA